LRKGLPVQEEELQVLSDAEYAVVLLAQGARVYWKAWGPFGDPMVRSVDTWTEMQRSYLKWLRNRLTARASGVPVPQVAPPAIPPPS
jgi:hypothetical protein